MPRPLRVQEAGVVYHAGSRAIDRRRIFGAIRGDAEYFLGLLDLVVKRYGWHVYAYCLMPNHFHLVVETPRANIGLGMQYLKGNYARWFNNRYPREGALFERRYWDRITKLEEDAVYVARYVVLNPIAANLADAPEEWGWSSYGATVGSAKAPDFLDVQGLLEMRGGAELGRVRFAQFVGQGIADARAARSARVKIGV